MGRVTGTDICSINYEKDFGVTCFECSDWIENYFMQGPVWDSCDGGSEILRYLKYFFFREIF